MRGYMQRRLTQREAKAADSRSTPADLMAALDAEFGFTLDPCPFDQSQEAGLPLWGRDGKLGLWRGQRVWCNPPYSDIAPWLAKSDEADVAVYLLPARTDMGWWHEYAMRADEIRFIRGRLRFGGGPNTMGAPFPSVVLVYRLNGPRVPRVLSIDRLGQPVGAA